MYRPIAHLCMFAGISSALATAPAHAETALLGIDFEGVVHRIDLGACGITTTTIGASGRTNTRALAQSADGELYTLPYSGSPLPVYAIDPGTGQATEIGTVDASQISSLAISPEGVFYATATNINAPMSLLSLDPGAGTSTLIGSVGLFNLHGLEFDSDGTLYGFAQDPTVSGVQIVDPATGAMTDLYPDDGGITFATHGFAVASEAFYAADVLGSLYRVDRATGELTPLGSTGVQFGGLVAIDVTAPDVDVGPLIAHVAALDPTPLFGDMTSLFGGINLARRAELVANAQAAQSAIDGCDFASAVATLEAMRHRMDGDGILILTHDWVWGLAAAQGRALIDDLLAALAP